jgi:hypothetical protein
MGHSEKTRLAVKGRVCERESLKADESWGCVSTINARGQTIFVVDAHRDDGKRFIVHADEKLTAFLDWEWGIQAMESDVKR